MIIKRQKTYSFHSDVKNEIKIDDMVLKKVEPIKLAKLLGKFINSLAKSHENFLAYDVYKGTKKIGIIELNEESKNEINCVWLEIDSDFRGEQRATRILKYFIEVVKKMGYKEMTLEVPGNSQDARHIYEKLGFKEEGMITTPDEDKLWGGLTRMRLKL